MNCKADIRTHIHIVYDTSENTLQTVIFIFFHSTLGGDKYDFSSSYLVPLSFSVSTLGGDKSTLNSEQNNKVAF